MLYFSYFDICAVKIFVNNDEVYVDNEYQLIESFFL